MEGTLRLTPPLAEPLRQSFDVMYISKPTSVVIAAAAIATAVYYIFSFFESSLLDKNGNGIPAGPRGSFPFLTQYPELTLDYWAKKFGDMYSIWLGNQLFVIISSPAIVKDLIVTNGAVFSSRKEMFIKSQTVFAGRGITATPYNDRWRKHRRIASGWLNQRAVDSYTPILDREATVLVKAMYQESKAGQVPINPQPHAGRASLNNMLSIVFGFRTDSIYHPLVGRALKLSREFMNSTGPMSNLVDFIPFLQNFRTPMRVRGEKLHQGLVETYGGFIKDIEHKMQMGVNVPDCLAKTMIDTKEEEQMGHLDMAILASAFMIGGVETTAAIMQWFSALIPAYPEIQRKAHEELDKVVGRDRLPTVEDEKNLPYCHAIIKEVERCHNPFWLGTPHVASEDFTYRGQFIPKDTVVVLNTWTMHHDASRHPEPDTFNPERYLDDSLTSADSANLTDPYQRDHWMFGAGRRICPGMIVAEREIWLTISRMLWAFTMESLPDEPIDLKEYDGLSGRSPVPFRINLIPRHDKVAHVLGMEEAPA
ncbi:cytochrome P450 [Lentinula aff. lateritia]|uniref:Cytochrome P450 n=1 Tax=Lentinula aff. lateritia TaxID=2804960 RepID=A0ACC1U8N9_9AGAR|nr:cytochrome P450 [Lentinula aff. lateritia]